MKIVNLPSLKVIRLKRVKIYLHRVGKFTAAYDRGEGGSGEKGGATPHHHVYTNVGKVSRLFIFVIIKQITFKLGNSTTLKKGALSQPRPQGAFPWLWAREERPEDEVGSIQLVHVTS